MGGLGRRRTISRFCRFCIVRLFNNKFLINYCDAKAVLRRKPCASCLFARANSRLQAKVHHIAALTGTVAAIDRT